MATIGRRTPSRCPSKGVRPGGFLHPPGRSAFRLRAGEAVDWGAMNDSHSRSFGRTIVAALVALVAAWFLLVPIIHLISWLFGIVLVVVALIALVWALRTLL